MRHGIVTIWVPLAGSSSVEAVRASVEGIGSQLSSSLEALHFASVSVIAVDEPHVESHMVFEASFDGSRETFVTNLVGRLPTLVDTIFRQCDGYPAAGASVPELAREFLLAHDVGADAAFIAFPNHSVGRIRQERRLRRTLMTLLAGMVRGGLASGEQPPPLRTTLYERLRRAIAADQSLAPLLTLPSRMVTTRGLRLFARAMRVLLVLGLLAALGWAYSSPGLVTRYLTEHVWLAVAVVLRLAGARSPLLKRLCWVALGLAFVVWLHHWHWFAAPLDWLLQGLRWLGPVLFKGVLALVALVVVWLVLVQLNEWLTAPDPTLPSTDPAHEDALRRGENLKVQNHLCGFNQIKPGVIRRWTLRLVLAGVQLLKQIENKGDLSGIATIHFARWVILKIHGRYWLLFLSNYDGDWDAYLGDFVSEASAGVTAIWSNCVGFPRAWFLFLGGSRDERTFKSYARKSQHETLFHFSAYPDLTVTEIASHAVIRETLGDAAGPAQVDDVLRRL